MKMNGKFKILLSLLLCIVLITAQIQMLVSCNDKEQEGEKQIETQTLGEGETEFTLVVDYYDDKETDTFVIHTDKTTVGAALVELGLIAGEETQYGLMVSHVNGVRADYTLDDGLFWAFYIGEEFASTGVDSTEIVPGTTYTFKAQK